jgi:hypothetical protein
MLRGARVSMLHILNQPQEKMRGRVLLCAQTVPQSHQQFGDLVFITR